MSRPDAARRRGSVALALGVLVGLVATIIPVTRVVSVGAWVVGGIALAAVLLIVSVLLRRVRVPALGVTLIEVALWVMTITAVFLHESAWFGVVPSPESLPAVSQLISGAVQEIATGAAPLAASVPLSFFIVSAIGALAIVLDHVVITTRMPLLAAVALVAVALVPTIAVPAPMDVGAFVLLAVSVLFLLRTDTRTRQTTPSRRSTAASGAAVAIGAVAVVVAIVLTPLLPAPGTRAGPVGGGTSGIDPTLRLGDDLRRPNPVEVLRVRTTEPGAPYLRAVTLSTFAGVVWRPDQGDAQPIGAGDGFGPVRTDPAVARDERETMVEVERLDTPYLPVPFPATAIDGLTGAWGIVAENRTVIGNGADTSGQRYTVAVEAPDPSAEQMRAAPSREADVAPLYTEIPAETPQLVLDLAGEVTAGTDSDFAAVAALQRWFRSSEFAYSLSAPVEDGFDGAGVDAVEQFLIEREGYCVHFASAFALMARSLGIPTRIVIGYLPGVSTGDTVDDRIVYSVTSDQLHSWPEVYFEGIGWVGFEPTNSLGTPPTFATTGNDPAGLLDDPAAPSAEPTTSSAPTARPDTLDSPALGEAQDSTGPGAALPALLITALILWVLVSPALVRKVWRRRQLAAARAGDVGSAWTVVQDTAIDLGIPVPPSESPRAFGARLVAEHDAPAEAVRRLVSAVEHASYAPVGLVASGRTRSDPSTADVAASVRAALQGSVPVSRRVLAAFAPRSLLIRAGSAAAGAGATPRAR
jgi:transglutaminase-like putative cysteine protease